MIGGFSTPKKDEALKVTGGQQVKTGQIVCRGVNTYKAGMNVQGSGTLFASCPGEIYFSRKKTPHGRFRTFINIKPLAKSAK